MALTIEYLMECINTNLKPIKEWMDDSSVTELMVNPGGDTYVERGGVIQRVGRLLNESQISLALVLIAKIVNEDAKSGSKSSMVFASIDDMRVSGALYPVSPKGSFFSIRKHKPVAERPNLEKLIEFGSVTERQAEILIEYVVKKKRNLIIAGGTGSGKTTLTNALLNKIPEQERIITIEDSLELQLNTSHWIPLLSNETSDISARSLVKLAMRIYPGRLVLGETRGAETYDLIRALNSGHDGTISTVHASDAISALSAIEMLFQMSLPQGASIPIDVVKSYIAKAIHVVVFAGSRYEACDDGFKKVRKIEQICLINGVKDGVYQYEELS